MAQWRRKPGKEPLVPIRVDRLRAAQTLDGRPWPEIARGLNTTHPKLFHLTHGEGPSQRRCRQKLRDGLASLLGLDRRWLSGETESLSYVVTADAGIVDVSPGERWTGARASLWQETPPPSPVSQLALDRLLAAADSALRRDLQLVPRRALVEILDDELPPDDVRAYGLVLIAQSVEIGIELVRPLPPINASEELRLSAILHMQKILRPWFDGRAYPDWGLIKKQVGDRLGTIKIGGRTLAVFMLDDRHNALLRIYERLVKRSAPSK